jgi:hypothetical protein
MTIFPRAVPPVATNSWSAPLRPPDRIESNPEAFPLKFDDYRRALIPAAISPSTILSKRIVRSSPP